MTVKQLIEILSRFEYNKEGEDLRCLLVVVSTESGYKTIKEVKIINSDVEYFNRMIKLELE